jgi:hypothetical protein
MKIFRAIRMLGLIGLLGFNLFAAIIPTTPVQAAASPTEKTILIPALGDFIAGLENGQAQRVVGVYVAGTLALKVIQQPANDPSFVNSAAATATQFGLAAQYGTIGLLAHNYLSGALFFGLGPGQEVDIVYGDGSLTRYQVLELRHFQARDPLNPASDFVDLDGGTGGKQISNAELFSQIYGAGNRVVFQTCINANGNASWGRLFVIAAPMAASIKAAAAANPFAIAIIRMR